MPGNTAFRLLLRRIRLHGRDNEAGVLENYYLRCKLRGLTDKTISCYAERLAYLSRWCIAHNKSLVEITRDDILAKLAGVVDRYSANTINGRLRVYHAFYAFLVDEGVIERSPMERVKLLKVDGVSTAALRQPDVLRLIRSWPEDTFTGVRNRTMVMVTVDGMLRSGELLRLRVPDVNLADKVLVIHKSKSRQPRYVPITSATARQLHHYLWHWREQTIGDLCFCADNGETLRYDSWYHILVRKGKELGIDVHPHALRHSAATHYVERGGSMAILQNILGHSDPRTTMHYVHMDGLAAREHHEKYSMVADIKIRG